MPQFTATVEAQYAEELRAKRDRTDGQIAAEYRFTGVTRDGMTKAVRQDRKSATRTRRSWVKDAAEHALNRAVMDAYDAGHEDLDDMTITITVKDLVATSVLTLPEGN